MFTHKNLANLVHIKQVILKFTFLHTKLLFSAPGSFGQEELQCSMGLCEISDLSIFTSL